MKKKILLGLFIILLALCIANTSNAAVGDQIEHGDCIVYTILSEDNKTVEITNKYVTFDGDLSKVEEGKETTLTMEDLARPVTLNGEAYTITSIGKGAFSHVSSLTDITIPDNITHIGANAFDSCEKLVKVRISDNVTRIERYAFSWCDMLKDVEIPKGITTLEEGIFNCCNLQTIVIPNNITTIGDGAFCWNNLKSITIPNTVVTIGESAFDGNQCESITIPDSVTTIGNNAFYNSNNLKSIIIPNNVKSIGSAAFAYSENLASITILNSKTEISDSAFFYVNDDAIIYGHKGSTAEKYAKEKVMLFVDMENNKKYGYATLVTSNNSLAGAEVITSSDIYVRMLKRLRDKGYTQVYCAYELSATNTIPVDGIELTFDMGTANNGKEVMVLHEKKDGKYEEFKDTVKDGKVKIKVKEFSPFMVAMKEKTNNATNNTSKENRPIDDEPPTGAINYIVIASAIATISLVGIVMVKSKNN